MSKTLKKVTLDEIPLGVAIEVRASLNIDLDFYNVGDLASIKNNIYKIEMEE